MTRVPRWLAGIGAALVVGLAYAVPSQPGRRLQGERAMRRLRRQPVEHSLPHRTAPRRAAGEAKQACPSRPPPVSIGSRKSAPKPVKAVGRVSRRTPTSPRPASRNRGTRAPGSASENGRHSVECGVGEGQLLCICGNELDGGKRRLGLASSSIGIEISTPTTRPAGPARCDAARAASPVPVATSSTWAPAPIGAASSTAGRTVATIAR